MVKVLDFKSDGFACASSNPVHDNIFDNLNAILNIFRRLCKQDIKIYDILLRLGVVACACNPVTLEVGVGWIA